MIRFYILLIAGTLLYSQNNILFSQFTCIDINIDSFEYNTIIPDLILGTTYQDTPQKFAGCVRTEARGM